MTEIKKVAGNTAALVLAKVVRLLISMALGVILARYLAPKHYGNWMAARSLCSLLALLIALGMSKIAIRECAFRPKDTGRYLGTLLVLKMVFSGVAILIALFLVRGLGYRAEIAHLVFIALGIYILNTLGESFIVPFRVREKMGYEAVINISKDLSLMLLVFLAIYLGWGVLRIAYIYLAAALFYIALSWKVVQVKFFRPRLYFNFQLARHMLIAGFPLGIAIFFNSYNDLTRIMLQKTIGSQGSGYYSVAVLPYLALESTVVVSLMGALFPLLARLHVSDRESLLRLYRRMSKYLYILSLPWAFSCLILGDKIILVFFGEDYFGAAPVLRVLGLVGVLMFQNYLLYNAMVASRKEKIFALVMGMSALINGVGVFIFSRLGGIQVVGGAIALGIAQLFVLIIFTVVLRGEYNVIILTKRWMHPTIAALGSGILIWWERVLCFPLGVILVSGMVVYGLLLFVLGGFDEYDRQVVRNILLFGGGES